MSEQVTVKIPPAELRAARFAMSSKPLLRALKKSGSTSLRDMTSEATKRIRAQKRLKVRDVKRAIKTERPRGTVRRFEDLHYALRFDDKPIPLIKYPHSQRRDGVSVGVNRGARSVLRGAFIARMPSGHIGIFRRDGRKRLPISEFFGSRPADAMLKDGETEAVAKRGQESLEKAFKRLLPLEMKKGG